MDVIGQILALINDLGIGPHLYTGIITASALALWALLLKSSTKKGR
jgi:hypothetical protein